MNDIPAFPVSIVTRPKELIHFNGMTLRDYFAAKALQGILTDAEIAMGISEIAELAYKYADAMMAARSAT
jgi:hypothetical protein